MKIRYNEETGNLVITVRIKGNKGHLSSTGRSHILGRSEGKFQSLEDIHEDLKGCAITATVMRSKPKQKAKEVSSEETSENKTLKKKKAKTKSRHNSSED